jgi:ABC-type uncharacterized transport system permease subunit
MPSSDPGFGALLSALLLATLTSATPLILAAMGGILSERAGVVNIALEGLILAGAFMGVAAGRTSAVAGLIAALAVGALLGAVHAFLTQKTRMNHVVSGLAITLLAAGGTRYLFQKMLSNGVQIEGLPQYAFIAGALPVLHIRFEFRIEPQYVFIAGALLLPFAVQWLLSSTRFGLRLRAVGENPTSARMAGIAAVPVRFVAVTLSGVCAALAGAFLSMSVAHRFSPDMSAGKGFIALAAVIFGKWHPFGAMVGALFFGFFDCLQSQLQISHVRLVFLGVEWTNPFLLDALPYLMTLAALVTVVGRANPPAALGVEDA